MDTSLVLEDAVHKAKKGDREAFRAVFDAGNDKLFRYFLGQVGGREESLDLLQDTFIDLWRALPRFRYRTSDEFWGFVFTIARRKVIAYRKYAARTRHIVVENNTLEIMHEENRDMTVRYPDDQRTLLHALTTLSDTSREILKLRYWSDLSFKEIAITTQTTENAAKVRHHRAIKELQAKLPQHVEQQFI